MVVILGFSVFKINVQKIKMLTKHMRSKTAHFSSYIKLASGVNLLCN